MRRCYTGQRRSLENLLPGLVVDRYPGPQTLLAFLKIGLTGKHDFLYSSRRPGRFDIFAQLIHERIELFQGQERTNIYDDESQTVAGLIYRRARAAHDAAHD